MMLKDLLTSESGATAIEYALIASLIAIAAIVAMGSLGNKIGSTFNNVASKMK